MMPDAFEMTKADREALVHYLRLAATHTDDAAARAGQEGMLELARLFVRQATKARELADRLEDAAYIRVGPAGKVSG